MLRRPEHFSHLFGFICLLISYHILLIRFSFSLPSKVAVILRTEILMGFDLNVLLHRVSYLLTGLKELITFWTIYTYQLQIFFKMKMSKVIQSPHCSHSVSKKTLGTRCFYLLSLAFTIFSQLRKSHENYIFF